MTSCALYRRSVTHIIARDASFIHARSEAVESGCWEWRRFIHPRTGYGHTTRPGGALIGAHVLSYEVFKGPVPEGHVIDHTCCVQHCVNPDHLEAVTAEENNRRISERGRSGNQNSTKGACPKCGGLYTTVYRPARPEGFRRCIPCHRAHQNNYERAQRAAKRGG